MNETNCCSHDAEHCREVRANVPIALCQNRIPIVMGINSVFTFLVGA